MVEWYAKEVITKNDTNRIYRRGDVTLYYGWDRKDEDVRHELPLPPLTQIRIHVIGPHAILD